MRNGVSSSLSAGRTLGTKFVSKCCFNSAHISQNFMTEHTSHATTQAALPSTLEMACLSFPRAKSHTSPDFPYHSLCTPSRICPQFERHGLLSACPSAVQAALPPIDSVQNAKNHSIKGRASMHRPSIENETQAFVFSTPSPSRTSLTVGSTRSSMIRIAAG